MFASYVYSGKNHFFFLTLLFTIVNSILFFHYGIKIVNDSHRYLEYANNILSDGLFFQYHNFWYISYVLFITICKIFSTSHVNIILAQVGIHAMATFFLYRASHRLFENTLPALFSSALFIVWLEIPAWNYYVLPESLYTSMQCTTLFALITYTGSFRTVLTLLLTVLITFFCKPTGISLLVAVIVFLISFHSSLLKNKSILIAIGLIASAGFLILLDTMLSSFILVENYATGEIVYGISTLPDHSDYNKLKVEPHDNLIIPIATSPLYRLMLFMLYNPVYFFKLAGAKLLYFLAHIKPYYSIWHNILIATTLYPIYFFFIHTLQKTSLPIPLKHYLIVYCTLYCTIIAFTTEDWDGRFLMPLLPILFFLAGKSISDIFHYFYSKLNGSK